MKNLIKSLFLSIDFLMLPFVLLGAVILKLYRRAGSKRLPLNTNLLKAIGVFPIRDHYYEPLFNDKQLKDSLSEPRNLPGINLDGVGQVRFLEQLNYQDDFGKFLEQQKDQPKETRFFFGNASFDSGDAEFLFNFVRYTKPKRIVEIGCGTSTKLISAAVALNVKEGSHGAEHVCIEPYEQPWLERFPSIKLVRKRIEEIDLDFFSQLQSGDLLFIDSSHMIRPQGDVVFEYLSVIPSLNGGVYVHVHDIFTPRDYLDSWVREDVKFWNEQYLLEATLSNNPNYQIVAGLNFLKHAHFDAFKCVCPYVTPEREPGSFYFQTRK